MELINNYVVRRSFVRAILADTCDTPHGPAEIADILTHKVQIAGQAKLAAFVLKGKSFATVRPSHVSHQIYRLEKIVGLGLAVFAASGNVLDAAKEQFVSTATRLGCFYAILDAMDLARLFVAYGFVCPRDALQIRGGRCKCGYVPNYRILNVLQEDAIRELKRAHGLKQARGLVVLPTGSGKTRIAAQDAKHLNAQRVLYVAHTHEILDQATAEFGAVFGSEAVTRLESPNRPNDWHRINLATIQTLSRHLQAVKEGTQRWGWIYRSCGLRPQLAPRLGARV